MRSSSFARCTPRRAGFTLVELMVAMALAAMISVSIMFISSQARMAYQETVKKVDVYNRFRYVLGEIEKDVRGWIPTSDLEFYTDGRGGRKINNHWEAGEEVPDKADARGPGVIDGGVPKEYDEYAHIIQRHYVSRELGQLEDKVHDAYQIYFRTLTYVDGVVREANVEYMLVDPSKITERGIPQPPERVEPANVPDLALYKIVRYLAMEYDMIQKINVVPVERRVLEVCTNVTDFKVEYLVDKRVGSKTAPTFLTPEQDFKAPVEMVTRPRRAEKLGARAGYRKILGYGSAKLEEKFPLAIGYRALRGDDQLRRTGSTHQPVRFGFRGVQEITFAELTPGDKIFVFTPSSLGGTPGGGAGAGNSAQRRLEFPAGDYTMTTNLNGELEFTEDIDSTIWQNDSQSGLYYKAAFIPAALRITLRMVDDKGENPKTMSLDIWPRRRSR